MSYLPDMVERYNNTKHTTTRMAPEEGMDYGNRKTSRDNIQSVAAHNRDLPPIKVGDRVKLAKKSASLKTRSLISIRGQMKPFK